MIKKIKIFIILVSLVFTNNLLAQDTVAFIDINFLFNNSSAGKKINEQINNKSKKINSDVSSFRKKVNDDKEKLLAQKNVISKDEYNNKFIELDKDVKNFNSNINKKRQDLINFQNNARGEFLKKLKPILEDYSSKNSIVMILRKENLLLGKKSLDITKNILELFNKNVKKITVQ
tara:strand:+ start:191 stop:715 length:525 start_codon:yes stop_codon:yes gene_type:complete